MAFKKGQSGNELGRPKGALNKNTEKLLDFGAKLKDSSSDFFDVVKQCALVDKDRWAIELGFNASLKIFSILQDKIKVKFPENADINMTIEAFQEALKNKEEYTLAEILDSLKILNSIKLNSTIDKSIDNGMKLLKDEELSSVVELINKRKEEMKES